MSNPLPSMPPGRPTIAVPVEPQSGLWDRLSTWASENKAAAFAIGGVAVVVTGGVVYYLTSQPGEKQPKLSKKKRRELKKEAERKAAEDAQKGTASSPSSTDTKGKAAAVESEADLPEVIDDAYLSGLSQDERKDLADRLKKAGNSAFGDKSYNKAIDLYSRAVACRKDPIYYSNRAACYAALGRWDQVVEDSTTALALDRNYVKAINRRAKAHEELGQHREALFGYTLSCIIDSFQNQTAAQSVERLLQTVAKEEASDRMSRRQQSLPSHTFVNNYFVSFRPTPRPAGLEDTTELPEDSGKWYLQTGLRALEQKTNEGYEEAQKAFETALKRGDLGEYEALAYNLRGTFRCLMAMQKEAMADFSKAIELDPSMTQAYIKLASMKLEQGEEKAAFVDFENALKHNNKDPDIFYHRAQLHFIKGEFEKAAKDYQTSIDLDRDFIFSHIQLAVTQYKMGSTASAMATFKRTIKSFPKSPDVYNYFGELLMDNSKLADAIEKFDMAVELENMIRPIHMNVLPLVNKALAVFQMNQDFEEAINLCKKALIIDPECDIAVATMAQLYLQKTEVAEALKYFQRAVELARTEYEMVNAISYAEATACQLRVQTEYPDLINKIKGTAAGGPSGY